MGLDGGFEAQLLLRQNGTPFQAAGQFSISKKRAVYFPGYHASLPVVIAVVPVKPEGAPPPESVPAEAGQEQ
ncbi:MAG: hypothetical protein LBV79_00380 [Candidatus Adiutrix sp.]|jgi:hypothetical protein|nr:hypothetical protein [Candidatus Adiutrix sp.]